MIIDCETHVFEQMERNPGDVLEERCRVEHLIEDMNRLGVDKTILMSYSMDILKDPHNKGHILENDWDGSCFGKDPIGYVVESWRKYPDRFFWFSVPDPRRPDCIDILEEQYKRGLQGLGETEPAYQFLMPNSLEFKRVYRFAAEKGLPIVLTMEYWDKNPNYFPSKDFDAYFDMMEEVIREFKDVRFMLGHGGNCGSIISTKHPDAYRAANLRSYQLAGELDNLWICSTHPWWFVYHEAQTELLEAHLLDIKKYVGFERAAWGSDWPWIQNCFQSDYDRVVNFYRRFSFCNKGELELLLGKSALEFIHGL